MESVCSQSRRNTFAKGNRAVDGGRGKGPGEGVPQKGGEPCGIPTCFPIEGTQPLENGFLKDAGYWILKRTGGFLVRRVAAPDHRLVKQQAKRLEEGIRGEAPD